jgi:putative oxidoreductase
MRALLAQLASGGAGSHSRAPGAGWGLALLRWASGAVFIAFGAGKFVNHGSEASSFRGYGLPWPEAFTYAIGVLELAGGLALCLGLATRAAAALLAADMVGAIVVSGLLHGETVSLTLAPALLVAMLVLIVCGPGRLSLDRARSRPRARKAA